jgi:hypothetical protein
MASLFPSLSKPGDMDGDHIYQQDIKAGIGVGQPSASQHLVDFRSLVPLAKAGWALLLSKYTETCRPIFGVIEEGRDTVCNDYGEDSTKLAANVEKWVVHEDGSRPLHEAVQTLNIQTWREASSKLSQREFNTVLWVKWPGGQVVPQRNTKDQLDQAEQCVSVRCERLVSIF